MLNQLTFSGLICLNSKHVFLHILFAYYLLVHVCVCVSVRKFSHRSQERVLDPWSFSYQCEFSVLNSGSSHRQQVLLTSKPSLKSLSLYFLAMFVVDTFKYVLCTLLAAINVFPHWLPFGTAEDSKLAKVERGGGAQILKNQAVFELIASGLQFYFTDSA